MFRINPKLYLMNKQTTSQEKCSSCCSHLCWSSAICAGFIATLVMTIVMALLGINIILMLGMMILGSDASLMMQYIAGGIMHFVVGIIYAIIYAAFIAPMKCMNTFLKGLIYGVILTVIAYFGMPLMADMLMKEEGYNPCMMVEAEGVAVMEYNPCNPCWNPCNPCAMVVAEEVVVVGNPCNPCGGDDALYGMLISFINHLVYSLTLAFLYCACCRKKSHRES